MKNLFKGNNLVLFLTTLVAIVIGLGVYALFYAPVSYKKAPVTADQESQESTKVSLQDIKSIDLAKKLQETLYKDTDISDYCSENQQPITIIDKAYFDFDKDGKDEVIVRASSCLTGTAGPDINDVFKLLPDGSLKEIPKMRDGYEDSWKNYGLTVKDGRLVETLPIYKNTDPNCCNTGGTRVIRYTYANGTFIVYDVTVHPDETTSAKPDVVLEEFVSDSGLFSALYPNQWKLEQISGDVMLGGVGPYDDAIYMKLVTGKMVVDNDAKFGSVVYWYDAPTQMWMMDDNELTAWDGNGPSNNVRQAIPLFYTAGGHPVFRGTKRWKTDIVALDRTHFLVVNITGGGFTKPLDPFVKTIVGADKKVNETALEAAIKELKNSLQ